MIVIIFHPKHILSTPSSDLVLKRYCNTVQPAIFTDANYFTE
jgi:hypothetical protein